MKSSRIYWTMLEVVASVVAKFRQSLVEPISWPVSYITHYQQNISLVAEQLERLVDTRARVLQYLHTAERIEEEIENDMVQWLKRAEDSIYLMDKFLKEEELRIRGWCMNLRRYSRSRKAKKIELEAMKLIERGEFERLYCYTKPSSIDIDENGGYYYLTDENAAIIKDIKATLKDNNDVKRIGVCGMSGVGKTRLIQNICMQVKEEGLFNKVVWARVGQWPNYERLRVKIFEGLDLSMERLEGIKDWLFFTKGDRILELTRYHTDVLIILDDVWENIDFTNLCIAPDHQCRIILISGENRSTLHLMHCERIWEVTLLSSDDSWRLFKVALGEIPVLNPLVKEVAHECGYLPLAIVVAAKALRGKTLRGKPDYLIWKDALRSLTRLDHPHQPIPLMDVVVGKILEKIYSSIQLGFNYLESEEVKSVFL